MGRKLNRICGGTRGGGQQPMHQRPQSSCSTPLHVYDKYGLMIFMFFLIVDDCWPSALEFVWVQERKNVGQIRDGFESFYLHDEFQVS